MSEIVNEAVIKVTADASGVEDGLAKVEQSAAKTGRTLESLGRTPGLKGVGEGAGAAAGQVDRATATMAASIQRTTAAMSAGAKGTAEYYAALASSRGLNASALRPYLDQLDAVTKKTAAAAEAQRQLETSTRFLDGLRSQADGIGKTASQLAALRAEQLGVTEAARPFIEQLREAEEAAGGAESSFGGLAQAIAAIGLGGGIAAVAQLSDEYGKYVSQLKLATSGQTEFANAQVSVRRIATGAQSDLSATASLYSSITKGTQELGIAQRQVADITETVSLALKVSGASGAEASSAILQLSQAFASGVLRGDEFNSVNEAAPRLMQALADGIGVPTGALRKMAEEGELTTAILADALPRALATLREEAKSVETIGGAYTVLKNNILELVGATAQSNGVVATLSGGINLLAENLTLAAGAMGTLAAVKLGTVLAAATREAYASVAANQARLASNVAAARADVAATASASALATARVAELRASVLAAEGSVALAIATNGLIPAQARAAAASAAHTAALSAQTAAMGAASIAGRAAAGAMALLGGPVGAVIGILGIAATAWAVWGDSASKAEEKVSETTKSSTAEVLESLDKQIAKLRERNRLNEMGFKPAEVETPAGARLGEVVAEIDRAGKGIGEYANKDLSEKVGALKRLGAEYGQLTTKIAEFNRESERDAANKNAKSAGEWMQKYATNAEKLSVELAKAKKELGGAFTPELEARIRKQFEDRTKGADKEISAYKSLSEAVNERIAATAREATSLAPLTEAQKLQARIDGEVASGKLKLTAAQKASLEARVGEVAANEEVVASQKRAAQGAADWLKIEKEWKDAAEKSIDTAVKEAERNEELARTFGLTKSAVEALELARLEEQLAQRSSAGLTLDEIANLEKLIDAKKRNAAALSSIEVQDANKKAADKAVQDWQRSAEQIGQSLTDNLMRGGKSAAEYLKDLFRTLILRPIIQPIGNAVGGWVTTAMGMPGSAQAGAGEDANSPNLSQSVSNVYNALKSGGTLEQSIAKSVQAGFEKMGASSATSSQAGAWAGKAGGTIAGYMIGSSINSGISNGYETGSGFMTAQKVGTAIASYFAGPIGGAIAGAIGGLVNRAFGMRDKESLGTTLNGSFGASGFMGSTDTAWKQDGGWFRSDKSGVDKVGVDATAAKQFTAAYDAIKAASTDFASVLGINADAIKDRAQSLSIALGKDEAANQKAIADFFVGVGNDIAVEFVPSLTAFQKAGEAASATLQRLATDYAMIDTALTSIGMAFGSVGVASLDARERLIEAAGGLEAFAANTAGFQQNFLTEAERNAPVLKSVTEQLAAMGLSSVDTRDEFKGVVLGLDLTTEAGAKQYGALMKLQAAFAQVYPVIESTADAAKAAADALAQTNKGYQDQINEILRSQMSPVDQRAYDTKDMDASTVALYDYLAGLKQELELRDKAAARAQEVAAEAKTLQDQYDELTMTSAQLAEKARNAIDPANRARYDEIQAIKAQQEANEKAKQAIDAARESAASFAKSFGDAVISAMTNAQNAAKAIRDFSTSLNLGSLSALDPDAKYREAKRAFAASDGKDTGVIQAFLQASKDRGADDFYYQRDFAVAQEKLAGAAAGLDDYAARLPAFFRAITQPAPIFTPAVTPDVVQYGSMSKSSAQQSDVSRLEAKVDQLIEKLGGTMEVVASSTSKLADQFDRVTEGGNNMVTA